ncbi:MAG TPA: GtrA family protein [Polyangiaceae bacterium]|nr:GtrA family protein [Polyangiaceae bacterium]
MWSADENVDEAERWTDRALRFVRALVVGSGATLIDFSLFSACIRLAGMTPIAARLPALCAGASVQFFGNRTYTFRAQAGSISRQARFFVVAELVTLLLNYGVFSWLVPRVHGIAPELVSFAGTFLVFVTFAYPMRRLVIFKLPSRGPGQN